MCQFSKIVLRHIPRRTTVLMDVLFRPTQMSGAQWSLHPSVFQIVIRELGVPLLDLFATRWNHKLPTFVSPLPDPSAVAVDALSMKAMWAYACPPAALLPQVLEKVLLDWCELILIAPCWPHAIWFPLLLGMLVDSPLQMPHNHRLLLQPRGLIHQDPSNLHLHVWKVSRTHSAAEAFRSALPHAPLDLSESLLWQSTSPSGIYSQLGASHNRLIHSRLLRV